jgi:hypothetical protein
MCELVISVVNRVSDEPEVDCALPKRGVVIDVFEDGHDYGRMELTHPMFRILKVPGASMAFARSFLGSEIADHPQALKRLFLIDLDHPNVPADLAAHFADDSRAVPHHVVDQAVITALKRQRPTGDPSVIGQPPHIIG